MNVHVLATKGFALEAFTALFAVVHVTRLVLGVNMLHEERGLEELEVGTERAAEVLVLIVSYLNKKLLNYNKKIRDTTLTFKWLPNRNRVWNLSIQIEHSNTSS